MGKVLRSGLLANYLWALAATVLCTTITFPLAERVDLINVVMVYMLGCAAAALWFGRGPSTLTAVANVIAFDYFMVPPRFSLLVYDRSYFVTFAAMLLISLLLAHLVVAVREQREVADARARHTAAMLAIKETLTTTSERIAMARIAAQQIAEAVRGATLILFCDASNQVDPEPVAGGGNRIAFNFAIAQRVASTGCSVGLAQLPTVPGSIAYLPLADAGHTVGVLVVARGPVTREGASPEQQRLIEGLAGQLTLALQRAQLMEAAQQAQLAARTAAMRNTLLASIGHDLRTPLSAIASAGGFVAQTEFTLDPHRRATLGRLIESKARDMSDLLSNVLDLVKLESGADVVNRDWHIVGDIIGLAIQRNEARLGGWNLHTHVPDDLPMVSVDATLLVQLLSNLLENAARYTPPGTTIHLSAQRDGSVMRILVEDDGPGWRTVEPERLFEKFSRGQMESSAGGVGLGLTICRVIAHLHGGEIKASASELGGARIEIELAAPMEDAALEAAAAEV